MPDDSLTNSKVVAAYRERTRRSERLAAEAIDILPSGIAHDARYVKPYGIYVERAKGPRKWDVDGNEYVDYFGGHGALLLGHNHPAVLAAMHETLDRGTHFGSNHVGEVRWGEAVRRLIPSAERVRFSLAFRRLGDGRRHRRDRRAHHPAAARRFRRDADGARRRR